MWEGLLLPKHKDPFEALVLVFITEGAVMKMIRSSSTEVSLDYFGYRCVDAVRVFISVYSTLLMHEKNKLCVPSLVKIERGGGGKDDFHAARRSAASRVLFNLERAVAITTVL